jgi:hypothetical protein
MKNKYYIPTEKELISFIVNEKFILGLIYNTDKLITLSFKEDFITNFSTWLQSLIWANRKFEIDIENYRIKYLDKEDIESLGFKVEVAPICMYFHDRLYSYTYYPKTLLLNISLDCEYLEIKIKNKSELKELLKKLDISNI